MITGKDARKELRDAKDVIASNDTSLEQKLEAVRKVVEVDVKVNLSIRASLVRVMAKLEVEKIMPSRTNDKDNIRTDDKVEG